MINTGGWLLLSTIFSGLLLAVQRAERKRRLITFIILAVVASTVWAYGIYRISNGCDEPLKISCYFVAIRQRAAVIGRNTDIIAVITALIFNALFWLFVGQYNPPHSSDEIKVLGMND